ncbi:hypothetical protein FHG87_007165 [Trinorchestia longiramus]|nr:hypothetical protein FHG87_007165 [Trinorchestia longiramus]
MPRDLILQRIREGGDGGPASDVGLGGAHLRLSPASFCVTNAVSSSVNPKHNAFSPPPPLNQPNKILRTYVRDPTLSGLVQNASHVQRRQYFAHNQVVQHQESFSPGSYQQPLIPHVSKQPATSNPEGFFEQGQHLYTHKSPHYQSFVPNSAPLPLIPNSVQQPLISDSARRSFSPNSIRQPLILNSAGHSFVANSVQKSIATNVSRQPFTSNSHTSQAYSRQHRSPLHSLPKQTQVSNFQPSLVHESPLLPPIDKSHGRFNSSPLKQSFVRNISQGSLQSYDLPSIAVAKQLPVDQPHSRPSFEQESSPPCNVHGVNQHLHYANACLSQSLSEQTAPRISESRLAQQSRDQRLPQNAPQSIQEQLYANNTGCAGVLHTTNHSLLAHDQSRTHHDVNLNDQSFSSSQSLSNHPQVSSRSTPRDLDQSVPADHSGRTFSTNTVLSAPLNASSSRSQLPVADRSDVPVNKVQKRHRTTDGTHPSSELNNSLNGSLNQSITSEHSHHSAPWSDQVSNTSLGESCKVQTAAARDSWMRHPQPVYANAPPKPKRQNVPFETAFSTELVGNLLPRSREISPKTPQTLNASSAERRTPDVYGATIYSKNEYEEMHDLVEKSPPCNGSLPDSSMPNHQYSVSKVSEEFPELDSLKTIKSNNTHAIRPQSADILDHHNRARMSYDSGFANDNDTQFPSRVRSQSSMGQEIDYWSEENYAQKMRQSSLYHSKNLALSSHTRSASSMGARVPPAGAATPDLYTTSPRYQRTIPELRERRTSFPTNTRDQPSANQQSGAPAQVPADEHNASPRSSSNSTLLNASFADTSASRSPSARMLGDRKDDSFSSSFTQDPEELDEKKIHLREESMKRLLEWKQRMLQSPLTKKTSPRSACPSPSAVLYANSIHARQRSKTPDGALNGASFQTKETADITRHVHGSVTPTHLLSGSHLEQPRSSQHSSDSTSRCRERSHSSKSKSRRSGDKDQCSNRDSQCGNNYEPQVMESSHRHGHVCRPHINGHGMQSPGLDSCLLDGVGHSTDPSSCTYGASRAPSRPSPQGARDTVSNSRDVDSCTKAAESTACSNCRRVRDETHAHYHSCSCRHDEVRDQKSSNRRRDEVRDGGNRRKDKEARRSASSSRCASYSSDENDRIEDRGSRRKTRRNSRRSSSSEISSNRKGDSSNKPEVSRRASRKAKVGVASPDYVNFSVLGNTDDSQSSNPDKPSPSNLRAEPIFIDSLGNEVKNMILNSSQETAPGTDINSSLEREILLLTNSEAPVVSSIPVTRETQLNHTENAADLTMLRGKSPLTDPRAHRSRSSVDDHCAKYSDSGYDTLRHDHNKQYDQKGVGERNVFAGAHHPHVGEVPVKLRTVKSKRAVRPETWSPGNFPNAQDTDDQIAAETDIGGNNKLNLSNSASQIMYPCPDLSLESPKIVRETQEATQRTLVQDRILAFSKLEGVSVSSSKNPRRKSVDDSLLNPSAAACDSNSDVTCVEETGDVFVAPIDPKFALSKSTVVKAYEAQVKSVHKFGKNCDPLPDESSDSKTPEDIVISRLSRNNLRRFLFEDEAANGSLRDGEKTLKSAELCETEYSHGVKDIRASFEPKLQSDGVTTNETHLPKRRPHSNMHMFSGHGPPSKTETELLNYEKNRGFDREGSGEGSSNPPRPSRKDVPPLKSSATHGHSVGRLGPEPEEQMYVNNPYAMHAMDRQHANPEIYMGDAPSEPAPLPPTSAPNILSYNAQFLTAPEENYLPMSPPRKPVPGMMAPSSSCSSLSSKYQVTPEPSSYNQLDNREFEEHTYIEMNGDLPKRSQRQLLALPVQKRSNTAEFDVNKFTISQPVESPRYYEINDKDETQHYEYIYRAASHYEAIYMELPGSRPPGLVEEKPDTSQASFDVKPKGMNKNFSTTLPSNSKKGRSAMSIPSDRSSDADDEASKDLESIDFPKNKRFSLSDTFRPASYYLNGAEPSSDPDGHESSDSDLVSPPPIPTSPPPLDELDHESKGSGFDFDNLATPEPPPHLRNALNASRSSRSSKRHSKEEISPFLPGNSSIKDSNSFYNPAASGELPNFPKKSAQERHESHNFDNFILSSEDQYPISAAYPDFDKFPDRSHSSISFNMTQSPLKSNSRIDNVMLDRSESSSRIDLNLRNFEAPGEVQHISSSNHPSRAFKPMDNSRLNESSSTHDNAHHRESEEGSVHDQQWGEVMYQNFPSTNVNDQRTHTLQTSEAKNLSGFATETSERGSEVSATRTFNNIGNCSSPGIEKNVHVRDNSTISSFSDTSPRSAPYYYSDVIRDSPDCTNVTVSPKTRTGQLNNQRDMENNKRQNIGRKVNRIGMSTPIDQRNLVSELRASAQIFEKNSGYLINTPEQNVGTSHVMKRAQTPSYDVDARNIYSATLFSKSDSVGAQHVHRRTRSLEGLMDDSTRGSDPLPPEVLESREYDDNSVPQRCLSVTSHLSYQSNQDLARFQPKFPSKEIPPVDSSPSRSCLDIQRPDSQASLDPRKQLTSDLDFVSDLNQDTSFHEASEAVNKWEDDQEWRNQLRRASLRHTKSLETLDENKRMPSSASELPPCPEQPYPAPAEDRRRSSHGLTQQNMNEYRVDYREGLINPITKPQSANETLERTRRGLTYLEGYEWDPAEEKFTKPHDSSGSEVNDVSSVNQFLDEGLSSLQVEQAPDNDEAKLNVQTCLPISSNSTATTHDLKSPSHQKTGGSDCPREVHDEHVIQFAGDGRPSVNNRTQEESCGEFSSRRASVEGQPNSSPVGDKRPTTSKQTGE